MTLLAKIKKLTKTQNINPQFLLLHQNSVTGSVTEFLEDYKTIFSLKRLLKKCIHGYDVNYQILLNKFILLYNTFGIAGVVLISVDYFTETEELYEYFCSLVFFCTKQKISNRMSTKFLNVLNNEFPKI